MSFTQDQIDRLKIAADDADNDGILGPNADKAAYYAILGESFIYGQLALGVVNNDTFAGIVANNFAENKIINDSGKSYTQSDELTVQNALFARDYSARFQLGTPSGVWDQLSGVTISNYHDDAFSELGYTPEAWTPYYVVRALDDYEIWRTATSFGDYVVDICSPMWGAYIDGDVNANRWLQDMRSGIVYNIETDSLELGDGVGTSSIIEYLSQIARGDLGNFYENELATFAAAGVGAENALVSGGLELALGALVAELESSGAAAPSELFVAGNGIHSVDLSALSPTGIPTDVVGLDIIKAGIKFDLTGDLTAVNSPPEELAALFAKIDEFDADALIIESASDGPISTGGSAMRDLIIGGSGNATLAGGGGDDLIYASAGHDDLFGEDGDDVIAGGAGADGIEGGAGADTLVGGDGPDQIIAGESDYVDPGEGNDGVDLYDWGSTPSAKMLFGVGYGHDTVSLLLGNIIQIAYGTTITLESTTTDGGQLYEGYPIVFRTQDGDTLYLNGGFNFSASSDTHDIVLVEFLDENGAVADAWTFGDVYNMVEGMSAPTYAEYPDSYTTAGYDFVEARWGGPDHLAGTENNDSIDGFGADDTIIGNAGDDRLDGGGGNDVLDGGDDDDYLSGGDGNDVLRGGDGNDRLSATAGDDWVEGSAGNDTIFASVNAGNDTYHGGEGSDTISFSRTDWGVAVDLAAGTATGVEIDIGLWTGIENVKGGSGYDTLSGTDDGNWLGGGSGSDLLEGRAGDDTLSGGFTYDTLFGGAGDDILSGGFGDDVLEGGADTDTAVFAGNYADYQLTELGGGSYEVVHLQSSIRDGTDLLTGVERLQFADQVVNLTASSAIIGTSGDDALVGDDDANLIYGADGNDLIVGDRGHDTLFGDAGDDTIEGGADGDTLIGGVGNDVFFYQGANGYDSVEGGGGDDSILGSDGDDTIGFQDFNPASDVETIDGGLGVNVIKGTGAAAVDNLFDFSATKLINIDWIDGDKGNDTIIGSAADDTIMGGADGDTLVGGAGNDVFLYRGADGYDSVDGGDGDDSILGGDGDDTIGFQHFGPGDSLETIDGGLGVNVIKGSDFAADNLFDFSATTLTNVDLTNGDRGNDTIIGTNSGDTIMGGADGDTLVGGAGNDVFLYRGADGYDSVDGGDGDDSILGGDGDDTIGFQHFGPGDSLETIDGGLGVNVIKGSDFAADNLFDFSATTLTNVDLTNGDRGNDTIIGTNSGDTIMGGADGDTLVGGAGNDVFLYRGADGYDSVEGGDGDDSILGSDGDDTIGFQDFGPASGVETIDGGLGVNVIKGTGAAAVDNFFDFSATKLVNIDRIDGDKGNDTIIGSTGDDIISGGAHGDSLMGRAGDDTLSGDGGNDLFIYTDILDAGDVIQGFEADGTDMIDLDGLLDSLDVADPDRGTRVDVEQAGTDQDAVISVDTTGDASFDTVVATVTNVTGDLDQSELNLGTLA